MEDYPLIVYKDPKPDERMVNKESELFAISQLRNTMMGIPGFYVNDIAYMEHFYNHMVALFFHAYDQQGLFFLARCCDRRYFKYGDIWKIEASVADSFDGINLPITYSLVRVIKHTDKVSQIESEIYDLIDNINYHFNHENFISGFKIEREKFDFRFTGEFITVK